MILRYLKVIPVSLCETAETSWKVKKRHANLVPKLAHDFIAIFHVANYLGLKWRNRLIPQLRVSFDLTGCRWVSSNPRQAKNNNYFFLKKNKRTRSDLEISQTNSALLSSNNRLTPKTYGLCVFNLVPKKATLGHSWALWILYMVLQRSKNYNTNLG